MELVYDNLQLEFDITVAVSLLIAAVFIKFNGLFIFHACQFMIAHESYLSCYVIVHFFTFIVITTITPWIKFLQVNILMVNMLEQKYI